MHETSWLIHSPCIVSYFLKDFIYLLLERGREGEQEGEKHQFMKETSIICFSHAPNQGPGPQPSHVP